MAAESENNQWSGGAAGTRELEMVKAYRDTWELRLHRRPLKTEAQKKTVPTGISMTKVVLHNAF